MIVRCSLRDLSPQIALITPIVDSIFVKRDLEVVMTSCWREKGARSLHPYGYAADFDPPVDLSPQQWKEIERETQDALGPEFDVLAHGPKMHLHVEWDPR